MNWELTLTLGVLVLLIGSLVFTRFAPDVLLAGGVSLLLLSGVLTPLEALAGLSNTGMVTVGVLYVVAAGLRKTGGVGLLAERVLGHPPGVASAQIRLMGPVAALSAFLNNTPVVAMFIPVVQDWARRHRLPLSRLLLPLSYAAILGGTCTLIGTSTNLVVNGLLREASGGPGLGLFTIGAVGLPFAFAGLVYLVLASRWLIPDRIPVMGTLSDPREYTVEMLVPAHSPLAGRTVEEAGLRHLANLYLMEIEREGEIMPAIGPRQRLQAGDRLVFVGVVDSVVDLNRLRGLVPATDQVFKLNTPRAERYLVEAVVSDSCALVGKTIRDGRFRNRYNAAVIAVARNGERVQGKIGDIRLRSGDTLLLEADPSFAVQQRDSRDFFLVSRLEDSQPPRHERAYLALGILVLMVVLAGSGLLPMLHAALLAAGLMLITRCLRGVEARGAVDWQVLIVIAASFALGVALHKTGAARLVADGLMGLTTADPLLALVAVYLVTNLLTELITNNAAAVLMFPIAEATAQGLGVDFMPFVITLMMAASASFSSPIGYQCNLMVYGPGGYRFTDYLRVGAPLNLLAGLFTVALAPIIWPFQP